MDWPTLTASLFGTTAIVAVIGYILQKSFDRLLDAKLKQIEERNKAAITEQTRRNASLFDKQTGPVKTAMTLVYRARNAAREVAEAPDEVERHEQRERLKKFRAYHEALEELLYEERATLPSGVFRILHEMKTSCVHFIDLVDRYRHARRQKKVDAIARESDEITKVYGLLDGLYLRLVACVQEHLGSEQDIAEPDAAADGGDG